MIAELSCAWGRIGFILSGAAAAFAASNAIDRLIELVYALKSQFRPNALFGMSHQTVSAVRKLNNAACIYLWRKGVAGAASLLGYPAAESEDMSDIALNSFSMAFGDLPRGYLIVDRQGARAAACRT